MYSLLRVSLYVSYSWPYGRTEWVEIFLGNPGKGFPGSFISQKKNIFVFENQTFYSKLEIFSFQIQNSYQIIRESTFCDNFIMEKKKNLKLCWNLEIILSGKLKKEKKPCPTLNILIYMLIGKQNIRFE